MDLNTLIGDRIYLDISASTKDEVFTKISQIMCDEELSSDNIYKHLISREELGSTALGLEVAIPHGRIKGLKNTLVSIVRVQDAIEFNSPDSIPVRLFISILVPEQANQHHLDLLASIASMLADDEFRNILLTQNKQQIIKAINNYN